MSEITPQTVEERRHRDDELLLVDVREATAFEDWHIPGSVNVPVIEDLKADSETAADALADLPEDATIVTVCAVGKTSQVATELLRELGYDAKTMVDGLRGWSRVHRTASIPVDGGEVIQFARPGTGCLSYAVVSDGEAVIVDPSQYTEPYRERLPETDATVTAVLETHAHADHVSGALELAKHYEVPYYLHPEDAGSLETTTPIEDGATLGVGELSVEVVHTPGHTGGSVTVIVEDAALLTGDTLFLESVGRPDLDGGDEATVRKRAGTLYDSIERILSVAPSDASVLPAHDPGVPAPPATETLGTVTERNAIVDRGRTAFVDAVTTGIPETPPNHRRIKRANVGKETLDADEARQVELGPNKCAAE